MPGNAIALDQRDEIAWRVAAQRRGAKPRIVGEKISGRRVQIGKIAAPAAGDANLLSRMPRLLEQQHRAPAPAGNSGAHQARGGGAEDDDVMEIRFAGLRHSTSSTSTDTPSFCLRDPTMMPSTGETSEKSRPTASTMGSFSTKRSLVGSTPIQPISSPHHSETQAWVASAPCRRGLPGGGMVRR